MRAVQKRRAWRPAVRQDGRTAPASAYPLASRRRRRGRHRRLRTGTHQARDAIVDHAHELQAREVGEGTHPNVTLAGLDDLAHGNADREAAAIAGGDDAIAALHAAHALQEREAQL